MVLRRLGVTLQQVPEETVTRRDWDTDIGEQFIRDVLAAERGGLSVADIGKAIGVDNLVHVVRARERYLR